jgi:excisionase family DNA binding protein
MVWPDRTEMRTTDQNQSPTDLLAEIIAERVAALLRKDLGLDSKRLFSVEQAAEYLGRTPHAVRHLIAKGELPKVQRGDNRVFLDREDLDRWIDLAKSKG